MVWPLCSWDYSPLGYDEIKVMAHGYSLTNVAYGRKSFHEVINSFRLL